ncbi:hypothetical protein ACFFUB_08340 [Algimonas porphyrae]|uniref:Alpha/beta hydrolase n=1 Tax=Algimonas porphyrae TaxID=1128113 RepID=A0ABQ5V3E9_9PROT|nr:hypothetical protein [Algimonas porphyrae]GLQ22054.1 hypothetical protein GCM10007854_30090 [Algimonas porphyrae]
MAWNPYDDNRPVDGWSDAEPEPARPRRRSPIALLVVLVLAATFVWQALSTPIDPDARLHLVIDDEIAYAHGRTDAESFADIRRQLDSNPQLEKIVLRHVPGTSHLKENVRIARMIRARGLNTHLDSRSFIASGGVDLFLAGVERTMTCGAQIGVHSWQDENGDSPASLGFDPLEDGMRAFHAEIGIDQDFYHFARDAAPHKSLYFLTREDLERFGILTDGPCKGVDWLGFLPGRQ